jgi:hypothetical protein
MPGRGTGRVELVLEQEEGPNQAKGSMQGGLLVAGWPEHTFVS